MSPIQKTYRAAHLTEIGSKITIADVPLPDVSTLKPGECLLEMECTGVCHSDMGVKNNDYPPVTMLAKFPLVGGHEGVGKIVALAPGSSTSFSVGQRVGAKWLASTCLSCEACLRGSEWLCPSAKFNGLSVNGTFQEYMIGHVNGLVPIPDGVDSKDAAPILCAGTTVYRALSLSNAKVGEWVAIPGAGGGLGHLAIQYATAMGFRVIAIDTGAEKKALCQKLGATTWVDFKETSDVPQAVREATGGMGATAAIVTTPALGPYSEALKYLAREGTLVCVGIAPNAKVEIDLPMFIAQTQRFVAVNVGNRSDCTEALKMLQLGKVKPHYVVKSLGDLQGVYDAMDRGEFAGRVVLDLKK